jgi:hypothetical protein
VAVRGDAGVARRDQGDPGRADPPELAAGGGRLLRDPPGRRGGGAEQPHLHRARAGAPARRLRRRGARLPRPRIRAGEAASRAARHPRGDRDLGCRRAACRQARPGAVHQARPRGDRRDRQGRAGPALAGPGPSRRRQAAGGRGRPRCGPRAAPVHRRHHGPLQGRHAEPRQPLRQRRAGAGVVPRRRPGSRDHDGGAAVLPRLRADGVPAAGRAPARRPGAPAALRPQPGARGGRPLPADAVPGRAHHVRGHQPGGRRRRARPLQHQGLPVRGRRPAARGRGAVRAVLRRPAGRGLRALRVLAGGARQPHLRQAEGGHHRHAAARHPGPGGRAGGPEPDPAAGEARRAGTARAPGDAGVLEPARGDRAGAAGRLAAHR